METTANKSGGAGSSDEISLKELVLKIREWYRYLLSKWKAIVLAGIVGGLIGFTYAYFKKPVYTAECTFVLEEQGGGGALGQYAGLASMVGIDVGGAGGSGLFQGDNIIELYKSRSMIQKALLTRSTFDKKGQLLINRYIEFNKLREKWVKNDGLKGLSFNIPVKQFKLQHDSIMGTIVDDINRNYLQVQKPDKKLSIISVKMRSEDEIFAKEFTEAIVKSVNSFYVETKTQKSLENLHILQKQADSVRRVLNLSLNGAALATDANPNANPVLQILRVPSQRKQIDVQASSAIYGEVIKNLEVARIALRNQTPIIQIVDTPVLPLTEDQIKKPVALAVGAAISILIVVLLLIIRRSVIGVMEQ